MWRAEDPQGNEAGKMLWELVPYTRGMGLDLGCGPHKAFPHFIGVDNCADTAMFGIPMKPDFQVQTCEALPMWASQSMNYVFSSHLLEHIQDFESALKEWWRVIKVGGHLCLYLPHKSFYPNIGQPGANPDHKHDFLPKDIIQAMKRIASESNGWDLLENQERNGGTEYSFFQVYKKLGNKAVKFTCDEPKPVKTCAVVRYGAFGDLLMASSIFPALKDQGYHLTLYTVPRGYQVVEHDPHIDRVVLQDPDQVPNHALSDFWRYISRKYDKFVNLSESVEGTFLALKGRTLAEWPHEVRHKLMDHNYLEIHHALANVPMPPRQRFYATEQEKAWARKERTAIGGGPIVLYSLSGSSVHKVWPHLDEILARFMMTHPDCRIVLTGDDMCRMLEAGWEDEKRVVRRSGEWTIRQTLAFLEQCDLVIGPETGVLNAAAFMPMPKVVTLSHSSVENLTKHWVNTISLTSQKTSCYPCHRMIYSWDECRKDELTGVAACQADISPDQMWDAITKALSKPDQEAA